MSVSNSRNSGVSNFATGCARCSRRGSPIRKTSLTAIVDSHLFQYPLHFCRSLLHDGRDVVHRDAVTARAAPRRAVDDDRQRGVREPDFFRQHGLRHARHADDVGAVAFQPVDFGRRFEPRALRCSIDSAIHYRFPRAWPLP